MQYYGNPYPLHRKPYNQRYSNVLQCVIIISYFFIAPPIIVTHPPPFFSINYGSSTTLSCSATGNNNEWAWFHNGIKIGDTRTVTVVTAGLQDSGGYQCFVSNPAGVDSRTTSLIVESKFFCVLKIF